MTKGLPPHRKHKLSKKAQDKYDEVKNKLYTAIRNGIIGYSKYTGASLIGSIQEVKPKERDPIQFLQRTFILIKILERLICLAINY